MFLRSSFSCSVVGCAVNMKDADKLALIRGVAEGIYMVKEVARLLDLSERRVRQLRADYLNGEISFTHGNSGRHPANYQIDDELKAEIIALKKLPAYHEINFTRFHTLLFEREGIKIGYTTLRGILTGAGVASAKGHSAERRHFRWRKRRQCLGEMLQVGADLHDWFGNGAPCVLHMVIDDATGRMTGMYFCQNECLVGYLEIFRQTVADYGIPTEMFSAIDGVFFIDTKKKGHLPPCKPKAKTGFGALIEDEFGIDLVTADAIHGGNCHKGLCSALHVHLTAWLKVQGITCLEEANREMHRYISVFNAKFRVRPKSGVSKFEPLNAAINLDELLTIRYERSASKIGCCHTNPLSSG